MTSRTISLEQSAYERLRGARRAGESFSDVVTRILQPGGKSLTALSGILSSKEADVVRETIHRLRAEDSSFEADRVARWRGEGGRRRR